MKGRDMMLRKMNETEFDTIFSIMETSFPVDEYRPYDEQKALLQDTRYCIYVLPDSDNGTPKGFIAVWQFDDFSFIEHFAVNPVYRNQGLGAFILQEISRLSGRQLCLEVELPQTDFAKRRIAFYKRNGFFLNEYPYMQPPISKGRQPIPLLIMTSGDIISEARFEEMKKTVYREVYKAQSL